MSYSRSARPVPAKARSSYSVQEEDEFNRLMGENAGNFRPKTVSQSFEDAEYFSATHPSHQALLSKVLDEVRDITDRETTRRAYVPKVGMPYAITGDQSQALARDYPEFQTVNTGFQLPGHVLLRASNLLANELCAVSADHCATDVAHYGGLPSQHLVAGRHSFVNVFDERIPSIVHQQFDDGHVCDQLFTDTLATGENLGVTLDRRDYDRYLQGACVRTVTRSWEFHDPVEALCVDISQYPVTPSQLASTMVLTEAEVAYGFFPYDPAMFFQDDFMWANTGVRVKRDTSHGIYRFLFTEGSFGSIELPIATLMAWSTGHTFVLPGVSGGFSLELLRARGPYMFFRLIRSKHQVQFSAVSHALEVGGTSREYLVNSYRLKSLHVNPDNPASWEEFQFLADKRLVDRVYAFGLTLESGQFTRYNLRRQLSIVNDRVVVIGTTVTVAQPLSVEQLDALSIALYARLFVDRYEASTLGADMRQALARFAGFSELTNLAKAGMIATLFATKAALRFSTLASDFVAWLSRRLDTHEHVASDVSFKMAPTYVLLDGNGVKGRIERAVHGATLADMILSATSGQWQPHMPGKFYVEKSDVDSPLALQQFSDIIAASVGPQARVRVDHVSNRVGEDHGGDDCLDAIHEVDPFEEEPENRHILESASVEPGDDITRVLQPDFNKVDDFIDVFNGCHAEVFPGVSDQDNAQDSGSLAFDPQDLFLSADKLVMPRVGEAPRTRDYFNSRVKALNMPRRQTIQTETLLAVSQRNLDPPKISLPQDDSVIIPEIFENFLSTYCRANAREKLAQFRADPVAMGRGAFQDWMAQSDPAKVGKAIREITADLNTIADCDISEYLFMLKSDFKPPLSTKPLSSLTVPQTIVYHSPRISSIFSSVFRVIRDRILSVLKPNVQVLLKKDPRQMRDFIQAVHPFGQKTYALENDFSKFDKSQARFIFELEAYIYEQFGMNAAMLSHWMQGHVECHARAPALAMTMHVLYQRKSGDATTALGNVLVNMSSVAYAYEIPEITWALFMGDDSLIMSPKPVDGNRAVQAMAEVFNLASKFYITDAPYFASTFIVIDDVNHHIALLPDPIKRIERFSMAISGDEPKWEERYASACDTLFPYRHRANTAGLARLLAERYPISYGYAEALPDAMASAISDFSSFRSLWHETAQQLIF